MRLPNPILANELQTFRLISETSMTRVGSRATGAFRFAVDRPLDPDDIRATLLHHLGIDYTQELPDNAGRPLPLCYGHHLSEWA